MWDKTLNTHVLGNEWIRKRYDTLWNEEGDTWKCNVRSYHQFDWAFALNFVGVFLMWNIYFKFRLLLSLCFGVGGHKSHKPKQVTCVLLTCWHDFVSFYAFPTPSSFFVLKEIETMRAGTYSVFLKSFHSFLLISIYGVKVSIIRVALYFYWNRDCFCHTPLFQND